MLLGGLVMWCVVVGNLSCFFIEKYIQSSLLSIRN